MRLIVFASLFLLPIIVSAEMREWTNSEGKKVNARYHALVGDKVQMILPNGQLFTVIGFSNVEIGEEIAVLFSHLSLSTQLALLDHVDVESRVEARIVCVDQLMNQIAKFRYMFGGRATTPVTIRTMIDGWPAASISLRSWRAFWTPGTRPTHSASAG